MVTLHSLHSSWIYTCVLVYGVLPGAKSSSIVAYPSALVPGL